jgi:amino acid transporter
MPDGSSDTPVGQRLRRLVFGPPRDLRDRRVFRHISLIAVLAWVGLGADGLSSSAYGPEETFRALGDEHRYLALPLAALVAFTVFLISAGYSRIIECFPQGGGGYVVATHLLGPHLGVVSGAALLVDYVLTITISIAAAGDALWSFLPAWLGPAKWFVEVLLIAGLAAMNIRGVRESVLLLSPIFFTFVVTHLVAIVGGIVGHAGVAPQVAQELTSDFQNGWGTLGLLGMLLLFFNAYSMGAGTYTGIEAVSNSIPVLREPRAETAKRTMLYMACSLAFTAAGLLICFLLWEVQHVEGKTLNASLFERMTEGIPYGSAFVILALISEGALLIAAAQAGFVDGPRVLANMAIDSWVPHHFASLSERLTAHNGVLLMAGAALAALWYTHGDVHTLVFMYSINVFVTFTLSMFGMLRRTLTPAARGTRRRDLMLFVPGFLLCATILLVTVFQKFTAGGWMTLLVTGLVVVVCLVTRRHYASVADKFRQLSEQVERLPRTPPATPAPLQPDQPTAGILVAGFNGLGVHVFMNGIRAFPGHFKNVVFLSVGVVDSGEFKGDNAVEALRERTQEMLQKYVYLAQNMGLPATSRMSIGTDVVDACERLCLDVAKEFPRITFLAGKLVFQRETWYQRVLHNETASALQTRLHWNGLTLVILPARVY